MREGLYVGVPVKLGARGVEQIIEIKLSAEERGCAGEVRGFGARIGTILGSRKA